MTIVWIVLAIAVIYVIYTYNRLLAMRNRIREAFGAIEVYLQNRFDTLVKVAEAVVKYAQYEASTLKEITRMREGLDDRSPAEKLQAFDELHEKLGGIRLRAEAHPELQASGNFLHLQQTANDLEEKLAASRRTYNANVVAFNTVIASFPANLFSGLFGFKEQAMYDVPESKKEDVDLNRLLSR